MKNRMFSQFGIAMAVTLLLFSVQFSFAAGTRAGAKLTSTATITYNDMNNSAMTPVSGNVSVYVAHKPSSSLSVATSNSEGYDGGYVVYTMTVTNTSNGQDKFQFLYDVTSGGAYLDSIGWYSNAGLTNALGGSTKNVMLDTVTADAGFTAYAKVYLKSDPDSSGSGFTYNGQNIAVEFYTRSTANMVDTTYLNLDGSNPRAVAASFKNAISSKTSRTTKVKQSKLTVTLTRGQAGYRPGSTTGYYATISNSGYGRAENLVLTVTYDANQSNGTGTGWTNNGANATYTIGTVGTGSSVSAGDSLKIDLADLASVLENSTRTPTVSIKYDDSTNGKVGRTRMYSNSVQSFTVLFKSYLQQSDIAIVDTTESGNPGDTVMFAYTITNNSNGPEGYNVRYHAASQGTWTGSTFWYEVVNAGFNASDDSLFAAGGSGSDVNTTKLIAKGSSITIYLRMVVPSGITTALTHIEHYINSRRDSVNIATDFNLWGQVDPLLPNIVVSRSKQIHQVVAGDTVVTNSISSMMPGDSVTFYVVIENNGDGTAKNVIITDDIGINANLSNVSNSAYIWDLATGTEGSNSDHVTIPNAPTTAGTLYGTITKDAGGYVSTFATLNAGQKRQVKYTMKVN
ncbi:MAG: DUF11 domain-containing protein [Bacteroidetes bacterium]|nr:DUF11 domain-containing protein [Bacteroidota bacterium]